MNTTADLILLNAHVLSMDPGVSGVQLVAVKNGKILAVGSNDDLGFYKTRKTKVVDCKGKTVLPGFIDAHCHFLSFAESFITLDLSPQNNIRSISDIKLKLKEHARAVPKGKWIRAKAYNEFYFSEKRHPTSVDLDDAVPDHPVILAHRTGHAHVLNSMAMKMTGISIQTPEPDGGYFDRDIRTGAPNGLIFDAGDFLSKRLPPPDRRRLEQGIQLANQKLLALGITSIHDASHRNNSVRVNMFRRLKENGLLIPRVNLMIGFDAFLKFRKRNASTQIIKNQLTVCGVKIMLDETTGRMHPSQKELNRMVMNVHTEGMPVAIHAVEETPIRAACSAIENALETMPKPDHRHRIEHCSLCPPDLAARIAKKGVMIVSQPPFIYYNGDRYLSAVPGDQIIFLYPFNTLIKNGVCVAGSSDCPVVPPNPLIGIYAAATRKAETGAEIFPQEKVSALEAIAMYTVNAARASFEESVKGTITPGKLADLVILSGNPSAVSPEKIKDIEVDMTIIEGKIVWEK